MRKQPSKIDLGWVVAVGLMSIVVAIGLWLANTIGVLTPPWPSQTSSKATPDTERAGGTWRPRTYVRFLPWR